MKKPSNYQKSEYNSAKRGESLEAKELTDEDLFDDCALCQQLKQDIRRNKKMAIS